MIQRQKLVRLSRKILSDNHSLIISHDLSRNYGAINVLSFKGELVLIGLDPRFSWNEIFALLEPIGTYRNVSTLLLYQSDPCDWDMLEQLANYSHPIKVYMPEIKATIPVESYPYLEFSEYDYRSGKVFLASENVLNVIPSPFIGAPDAMMIYDAKSKTLFSNHLFDIPATAEIPQNPQTWYDYLKKVTPSSLFIHPVIDQCRSLDILKVVTAHGLVIEKATWIQLVAQASRTDFYNNAKNIKTPLDDNLPYRESLNQIINKLRVTFGDDMVKDVLSNTSLPLDQTRLAVMEDALISHSTWHHLFESIYIQKGEKWLSLLEPIVVKINAVEGIEKPSIYTSLVVQAKQDAAVLGSSKEELERELTHLKDRLSATENRLVKDQLTGHYNELFLKEYLLDEIQKAIMNNDQKHDLCLIGITIDNLLQINAKYSKEIGDETILNVAYLLDRIRHDEDMLFKRNGPGFFWLHKEITPRSGELLVSEIQTQIAKSDLFIQSLTASLAVARLSEFSQNPDPSALCELLLKTVKSRLELLYAKGPNSLVDDQTKVEISQHGTLLIVDDEQIQRKLLSAYFFKANFLVETAQDGIEALEIAQTKSLDAIIAAKNLPKLDGLSLKNQLNEMANTANILFILTTYRKTPDTIMRANRFNVDHVLEKPLIFEEILGLITRHQRLRR